MRANQLRALSKRETRSLVRDPLVYVLLLAMPLILIVFLSHGYSSLVRAAAHAGTNPSGADFAVPAFAIFSAFYLVGFVTISFMNEHGWSTWERLRVAPLTTSEILFGKTFPYVVLSTAQLALLLVIGWLVFGMHVRGSIAALVLVVAATIAVVTTFAFVLIAVCNSTQQAAAFTNLFIVFGAALGGVLFPIRSLAGWVQAIAPFTPHYWAMQGFEDVILKGGSVGDVVKPVVVLFALAVVLLCIALARFRFSDAKLSERTGGV